MRRRSFISGSVLYSAAFVLSAEDAKPNFSGRWRMVKEESDFGGFTVPDIVVRVIDQRDPTMNIHTVQTVKQKTTTNDVTYMTDGSMANNIINGKEATSKAFWDGNALVIRTNMKNSKGEDVVMEERYTLSDDGQTLTTTSSIRSESGGVDMKLVSRKEKVN
ncbi:MAG: hypothetical protein JO108_07560 [Acidobacteriaceae bacterium]|nr:hypothetical protein [Acidobacteriaceae bacterium]